MDTDDVKLQRPFSFFQVFATDAAAAFLVWESSSDVGDSLSEE
jgi:hypothetical protein